MPLKENSKRILRDTVVKWPQPRSVLTANGSLVAGSNSSGGMLHEKEDYRLCAVAASSTPLQSLQMARRWYRHLGGSRLLKFGMFHPGKCDLINGRNRPRTNSLFCQFFQ